MSAKAIDAILFDMGGTLSYTTENNEADRNRLVAQIQELVGSDAPLADFARRLLERGQAYRKWAKATMVELDEARIWVEWMLPEFSPSLVAPLAARLNLLFLKAWRLRYFLPGARETVLELFRRGYRLGMVSNTTSTREARDMWDEAEMGGLFETVLLSCNFGRRKPDPAMLAEAAARLEVPPPRCAYVGDRPDRDVAAARQAGYGQVIIIHHDKADPFMAQDALFPPDHQVTCPVELLDFFPPRARRGRRDFSGKGAAPDAGSKAWNASLSTMWAIHNFPHLDDFCTAARRLGFAGIELNHQVTSAMLDGARLDGLQVGSVHEPCPADISTDTLKKQDWIISAIDEDCRQRGILAVKRSIDLAKTLGARTVVIHAGHVHLDYTLEKKLGAMLAAGRAGTDEYQETKARLVESVQGMLRPRLEAAKKSLSALLEYAAPLGIRLGLENRYHLTDLPGLDEMAELLALAEPERLGFVFDTGHARAQDNLGFAGYEEWLKRYSSRLYGAHLHDINGTADHGVPGSGEIDFTMVGSYLPPDAFRTLELSPSTNAAQIREGLVYLYQKGCVTCLTRPS